jgi:methionine-rich copper-binding protein CopC
MSVPEERGRFRVMPARRSALISYLVLVLAFWAIPARAHGILHHAEPAPDSTVQKAPSEIVALLTEPPVPQGKFVVKDGCDRTINDDFEVDNALITAAVGAAQPGLWHVRFDFISKVDGHRYAETYSFKVAGKKDCSKPHSGGDHEKASDGEAGPGDDDSGSDAAAGPSDQGAPAGGEGSFPIVPVALGSVALVGVALLARRSVRG